MFLADLRAINSCDLTGKQATIPCGSSAYLYANPDIIYFTVTLTAFNSKCKPVNSGDWVKKLQKQKGDVHYLDIELDFGGGRYFASLRLSRGERGILEVVYVLLLERTPCEETLKKKKKKNTTLASHLP